MLSSSGLTRRDLLTRLGGVVLGGSIVGTLDACSYPSAAGSQRVAGATAASTPSSTVVSSLTTSAPAPAADTPRTGGTLRYATLGDFPTLDGHAWWLPTFDNLWNVWDRLTYLDSNSQPQPMLAETWTVNDDHTQLAFNVRRGVQFHTGRELTADDVKFSLVRMQDRKVGGGVFADRAQVMTSIEAPDRYRVVVTASRPWPEAFEFFEYANIVDPVTLQDVGNTRPTGTGPFVFSEYVQGDHLRLVRNPNYWRTGRPYLDELLVYVSHDAQASVVQLESQAIDIVGFGLPVPDAVRLQNDPAYTVMFDTASGSYWHLLANCTRPPTDTKQVRQALNFALDRKRIAETTWRGRSQPEALPWTPSSPAYDAAKADAFAFDLDKARSLLASSGQSNMHLELVWSTSIQEFAGPAQIFQADLAKVGVTLELRPLEPPALVQAVSTRAYQGLILLLGFFGQLQPATLLLSSNYSPRNGTPGFSDEGYTQLVNRVLMATDPGVQKSLYAELNDYWLDQAFAMPIVRNPPRLAAHTKVRGLRYDAHESLVLADAWLAA